MISKKGFLSAVQEYVAVTAIGASSLRNQGAPKVIKTAREFLGKLDLSKFVANGEKGFKKALNSATNELRVRFPRGAKNWGAARKAINLFLSDALYNRYLTEQHHLHDIEPWLEIPLDGAVTRGIIWKVQELGIDAKPPRWPGIRYLKPRVPGSRRLARKLPAGKRPHQFI